MATPSDLDTSFGRQQVVVDERRARIRRVFDAVAPRYDLMNDLMSFGIHRLWKRILRRRCSGINGVVVDLAGGTGDVARLLVSAQRYVIVCDPSRAMMLAGRAVNHECQKNQGRTALTASDPAQKITWVAGEAETLPLANSSVDLLTISFGLRNATQLRAALDEIHRVLKPGGRFVCLEFSRPQWWLAPFYNFYSWLVIPRLGAAVARQPMAYQYLVESIRRFPDQQVFADMIGASGFDQVRWENLSFGIACLHSAQKAIGSSA